MDIGHYSFSKGTEPMQVGMILDAPFPPDPRVENEAKALIECGYQVHLFCLDYNGIKQGFEKKGGLSIHRYKVSKFYRSLSAWAYTIPLYHILLYFRIKGFLKANNIQIIHVHDMQIARAVFWANHRHLPVVLDLHERRPEIMKFYPHLQTCIGRYTIYPSVWEKYERRYMNLAKKVIVVTEEAKKMYEDEWGIADTKFSVVTNTIDEDFVKTPINRELTERFSQSFNILYIGETGLRRGLKTVLEALKLGLSQMPHLHLIVVGKSRADSYLHQYAEELGISKHISWEGWQPPSTFSSYISVSSVGLSPLTRNLHHDTTLPNKLFQYLSFGIPVLVSDCVAQEQVVRKHTCGLVFKAEDNQALREQIFRLYKDEELRINLGMNGKKAVSEYWSWDIRKRELVKLYEGLVHEGVIKW